LYGSEFNTGYMACGDMNQAGGNGVAAGPLPKVLSCRNTLSNPPEFIPAEAMGTIAPEVPGLQELQRVPVPHGQPIVHRV
jgi:hypothetical protein